MSSIPLCNVSRGKHITITTNTSHFANFVTDAYESYCVQKSDTKGKNKKSKGNPAFVSPSFFVVSFFIVVLISFFCF